MFDLPKRVTLSGQAAAAIRKGIADGTWKDFVPSERRLCELLRVSRPTVRTSLQMLVEEGLIQVRQGCRNRIVSRGRSTTAPSRRLVAIVLREPLSRMTPVSYRGISEIRADLAEQGFATEIFVCPTQEPVPLRQKMEVFIRQNNVFCCLLVSVSKTLQEWFAEYAVPALVLGSCHPAIKLPSLDMAYRAVCRHAGGVFLAHGHRRMAMIVPETGLAGDLASEEGFLESVQFHEVGDEASALIVRYSGASQSICAKLDRLFDSAQPPTALLLPRLQDVLTVMLYLLRRGMAVPDQVSIIARDYDDLLAGITPPISHYSFKWGTYQHRLTRLMLRLVSEGHLPPRPNLIFPRFVVGGTVKRQAEAPPVLRKC